MTVAVFLQRQGFFGPCLHTYKDCADGPGERITVDFPESAFPLPTEWCCSKCGDALWMVEGDYA